MYDPLIDTFPKSWQGFPASYWAAGAEVPVENPLSQDIEVDIAIIGGGYTGLSAAYALRSNYQADVAVLESNSAGWGCSGRNAGFVLPGTGRLSLLEMEQKWGETVAKDVFSEFMASIETVNRLIELGNIECDKTQGGYLKLAHRKKLATALQYQADKLSKYYQDSVRFIDNNEVNEKYMRNTDMFGGIYFPQSFALNPLKLAKGVHKLTQQSGARVYTQTPVMSWTQDKDKHVLRTSNGKVTANRVIIATNGYTAKGLNPLIKSRHFPVLSSVMVTRPLTQQELESLGFKAGLMAMDTRPRKFYYRILPDNRILFGGRGAIAGEDADLPEHRNRLLNGLHATFPSLQQVTADFFWSGWISASYDNFPRIYQSADHSIHYSMGYCGSGLAFSMQAGKRLAQSVMDPDSLPDLPFWQSPLRKYPFAPFRRLGLRAYFMLANLRR